MKSLTRFGTYGFLSMLLATQLSGLARANAKDVVDSADRTGVNAKKSARSFRRDVKKAGRKASGQDNTWDDLKDGASDAKENIKDEARYQKRSHDRKESESR